MIGRLVRNSISLIGWLLADSGLIALNFIVVLGNYMAIVVSFVLSGFDPQPLEKYPLVGPFFGTFFGQTTLADFYAVALAAAVAVGLFLIFKFAFRIFDLIRDRRAYLEAGDQESAQVAIWLIIDELIAMLFLAIPLLFAIWWDIELFKFRSVAGAELIEDPEMATRLKAWEVQLKENWGLWAWRLAQLGGRGYIAVTAIAAAALEIAFRKTGESWVRVCDAVSGLFPQGTGEEAPLYGYDQDGQPVYDPHVPVAYDVNGHPVAGHDVPEADVSPGATDPQADDGRAGSGREPEEVTTSSVGPAGHSRPADGPFFGPVPGGRNGTGQQGAAGEALFDPEPATQPHPGGRPAPEAGPAPRVEENLREVIGSAEGKRVSPTTALADREQYWVDPETHEIWDAKFREALLAREARQEACKEEA